MKIYKIYCHSPKAIETVIRTVDRENRRSCIGFSHTSISLEDDYFCPYLVVYLVPLVKNLLYMILESIL